MRSDQSVREVLLQTLAWICAFAALLLICPGYLVLLPLELLGTGNLFLIVILILPFVLVPASVLLAMEARRRPERSPDSTCPDCGYDLRGSPEHGCPECGWGR